MASVLSATPGSNFIPPPSILIDASTTSGQPSPSLGPQLPKDTSQRVDELMQHMVQTGTLTSALTPLPPEGQLMDSAPHSDDSQSPSVQHIATNQDDGASCSESCCKCVDCCKGCAVEFYECCSASCRQYCTVENCCDCLQCLVRTTCDIICFCLSRGEARRGRDTGNLFREGVGIAGMLGNQTARTVVVIGRIL